MFVLNILLTILSVSLYLLAFLLLIAVIVLISPVRYRLVIVKNAKLIVDFDGTWLFRLVKFSFRRYEDKKNKLFLKAFGKTLIGGKKKKKRKKSKPNQTKKDIEAPPAKPPAVKSENTIPEPKPKPKTDTKPIPEKEKINQAKSEEPLEINDGEEEEEETKSSKIDLVKKIIKFPYKKRLINKTVILIKRLIRALKPNKFTLQTVFGTGDPDTTGLILGSLYGVFGVLKYNLDASGDFEKARLDLDLYLKGSFTFGRLIFILFLYVISKPVWEIIKIYRGKSKLV